MVAKPETLMAELSQAEAGTEQCTLFTHGWDLHRIEHGSPLDGAEVPQSFLATAEALKLVDWPPVQWKVIVVSNCATAPAATLNECEPRTPAGPLSVIVISPSRLSQLVAKPESLT